jgi:transcriptional regulator of acetoin/glycerol metabolism
MDTSRRHRGPSTRRSPQTDNRVLTAKALAIDWMFPCVVRTLVVGPSQVLGRDNSCDVVLESDEISRRHVEMRLDGETAIIQDLGSRNGLFLNGTEVSDARLAPDDVIRMGNWVGIVTRATELSAPTFGEIASCWYGGAELAAAVEPARRAARINLPIIVQGETGTGKEGLARAIHEWSGRSGSFVAVNCAALPETLAEGELFGYRKGAFTGADRSNDGYFRNADRGTLLLDEILDLPLSIQGKLLRVLEQHEVRGLGESHPTPVDVAIIAAAQASLSQAVADKRFRADLLARLDGVTVTLPPLRHRRAEIVPLFFKLLGDHLKPPMTSIDPKLLEQLLIYDWPLNIRELVLVVRRLLAVHGDEPMLKRSHLPERIRMARREESALQRVKPPRSATDDDAAFDALVCALRDHGGNVTRAAAAIGVTRSRAYRLLESRPEFDPAAFRGRHRTSP